MQVHLLADPTVFAGAVREVVLALDHSRVRGGRVGRLRQKEEEERRQEPKAESKVRKGLIICLVKYIVCIKYFGCDATASNKTFRSGGTLLGSADNFSKPKNLIANGDNCIISIWKTGVALDWRSAEANKLSLKVRCC